MTLVILAAGIGSRYGGNKQVDALGPDGAWLMDYALFDALRAGFKEAVLIIRKEMQRDLEAHLLPRWDGRLRLHFVAQTKPKHRKKPWGTAEATLCAEKALRESFALINADDFYGSEAFHALSHFLKTCNPQASQWTMVGYTLENTLSSIGSVSRGICKIDRAGYVKEITEKNHIISSPKGPKAAGEPLKGNTWVSMNCWGFTPTLFRYLRRSWQAFYRRHKEDTQAECYLPEVINEALHTKKATVHMLPTHTPWMGVTYAQERSLIRKALQALHQAGIYPQKINAEAF